MNIIKDFSKAMGLVLSYIMCHFPLTVQPLLCAIVVLMIFPNDCKAMMNYYNNMTLSYVENIGNQLMHK
jgi:hypothetical protein